jgi:hypothetical protein
MVEELRTWKGRRQVTVARIPVRRPAFDAELQAPVEEGDSALHARLSKLCMR